MIRAVKRVDLGLSDGSRLPRTHRGVGDVGTLQILILTLNPQSIIKHSRAILTICAVSRILRLQNLALLRLLGHIYHIDYLKVLLNSEGLRCSASLSIV